MNRPLRLWIRKVNVPDAGDPIYHARFGALLFCFRPHARFTGRWALVVGWAPKGVSWYRTLLSIPDYWCLSDSVDMETCSDDGYGGQLEDIKMMAVRNLLGGRK